MKITNIFILLSILLILGCNNNYYFESTVNFPESKWKIDEYAKFDIPIDNIENSFDVLLTVNVNEKYPYQNLWVFSNIISPSGVIQKDTINLIFDPEFLKNKGCGKENCEYIFKFADSVKFIEPGNYIFEFNQGLRQDLVTNINSISIILDKKNN